MDHEERAKFNLRWKSYPKILMETTGKLLATGQFSDVTLACADGQKIRCHRTIIAAFSPYLAGLVEGFTSPEAVICLGHTIKFNQLKTLLHFMYCGEAEVTQEEMADLLKAAEELQVKGLYVGQGSSNNCVNNGYNTVTGQDIFTGLDDDSTFCPQIQGSVQEPSGLGTFINLGPVLAASQGTPTSSEPLMKAMDADSLELPSGEQPVALNLSTGEGGLTGSNTDGNAYEFQEQSTSTAQITATSSLGASASQMVNQLEGGLLTTSEPVPHKTKTARTKRSKKPSPTSTTAGMRKRKARKVKASDGPAPLGENMRKALSMMIAGGKLSDAAKLYHIPQSTLSKYSKNPNKIKRSRLYSFE